MLPPRLMQTTKNRARLWPGANVALFCVFLCPLCGCTPPGPRALLDGKRLIDQHKYSQAIARLKTATSLMPTNGQAWNYLGLACHYAGQADLAESSYRRALVLNHDLTESHYNLACLFLEQNRPDKTEAAKTELLAFTLRRGNSAAALLKLGLAQVRTRELVGAEKSFTDALRLSPQNPEALNGLGLVRLQRGRADEAAKYFRTALQQQPGYGPALLNLAIVSQEYLKDKPLALQKYREYAALKPPPPDVQRALALARQLEDELKPPPAPVVPRKTESVPATVSNRPPVRPTPVISTGAQSGANSISTNNPPPAFNRPPNLPQAESTLSAPRPALVVSAPSSSDVETVTLAAEPIFKPAQDVASPPAPVIGASPEPMLHNPTPPSTLASERTARPGFLQRINPFNFFRGTGKNSAQPTPLPPVTETPTPEPLIAAGGSSETDANASTNSATPGRYAYRSPPKPSPGNRTEAQRWFDQGVQAQQTHKLVDAREAYRRATEADPSFFDAHYNLGLTAAEAGDLPSALAAYEGALAARPESLDARYNLALALKQANYIQDAVNELEKLLALYPNEGRVNLALGNIYAQQWHQPAKARQYYLRVLESDPHNPQAGAIRYWLAANQSGQ